ncbi:hypothetical protein Tco_0704327 [Tanacetum coccineum]|uniref:Reverse transcriptase Ty1/copia-type domain-containing protein n=1 Tax=Tanacetum coccineum TaxID=301880 RepID=A0ABQ4Y1R5_9ASTR
MADHSWIESMQDDLNQFERLQVWELVPRPEGKMFVRSQLAWKNKYQISPCIFISQSQYAIELLKKHGLDECVSMSTPMATERLDADLQGTPTDQTTYCRMIGGLMYLTASRPDIAFATFVCARYQARPTDSGFKLIAYSDADHAGCKDDCKSTSGGLQFLGGKLVSGFKKQVYCDVYAEVNMFHCLMVVLKSEFIIMAQQQHAADVHPDELCPPNKRYDLMDANKKFWHTLKEDGSKHRLKFLLDRKEITLTLDDFRTIFHLPQANDNNHASFVPPPIHPDMFHFTNKCWDLQWNSRYYEELMWEGIYYSLHHPVPSIPYPRFMKIIISYYMTIFPDISRRARDAYHNLQDDDIMKNIFNLGRNKNKMSLWTQFSAIEFYPGTHRTPSAPRSPNPATETAESMPSIEKADEMILQDMLQVSLAEHKSREEQEARENVALEKEEETTKDTEVELDKYTPMVDVTNIVTPVNVDDEEDEITDEVFELRRRFICTKVNKNNRLLSLVKAKPNRFKRYKSFFHELQKVTEQVKKEVPAQVRDQVPVYLAEGLILERKTTKEETERLISKAILQECGRMQAQISSQIQNAIDNAIPSLVDASVRSYMSGHILHVHPAQVQSSSVPEQQHQLYLAMKADPLLQQQDIAIWLALQMKFEKTQVPQIACRSSAVRTRDQDDPHDDAHPEGENSAKRQKTSEYEAYVSGESSSGQVNVEEPGPSTSGNQEQDDEFDFWTDSYASDDDEIPTKQVTQDIMEEISLTIDEAKLKKMADEMLRQRCTSGDEHQYHIDQMKNFLQSDIVWESRKEILVSPHPRKITPLVQSCQRDPEAPALSLINQDLLYLKKGNSGPEKIVLSLHKFPAIVFNDDDIEERTSRWVNKCIKKFNPYARYGVENWKNPHAKIFYIRRQKEPGRPKEEIYSNSKIVQVIKTYWELGHEHKFITEIVARRANDCIVSITEPDYKNLNKNDIEDMYLLIVNNKVPDYANTGLLWSLSVFIRSSVIWERVHDFQLGIESYQQKINLTAPTITFPGIEEYDVFSIVYEPVHGIIYTNSKKEKRVMRHSEIHKFCDATLRRTLEGLKSYYNDVKYGYVQKELTNDEVEFLKLFEEEIEVRLNYRDQMRRWEMYVNGRPLGPRRERPE